MQKPNIEKILHIGLLEKIDRPTARQIFQLVGAHILPFNDPIHKDGCISAIALNQEMEQEVQSHIDNINLQGAEAVGYRKILSLVS